MTRAAPKLAINRLLDRKPLDDAAIDRFIDRHGAPIIEGSRATFLWRGHADEVVGAASRGRAPRPATPAAGAQDTDLWYVSTDIPEGSRIEYQFEVTRDGHTDSFLNDPLNPKLAHGPFGASSVCAAAGYHVPDWTLHDPGGPTGRDRRAHHRQQGAASPGELPPLPAGALPAGDPLPAARRARRPRLPHLRLRQDRPRQPDPPQRGRRDGGRLRLAGGRPAGRVRQQRAARAVHRPRAGARADRRAAAGRQPCRPHPDGLELRRASRRCPRPLATPASSARCCSSRRRWCSPTSARTTAAGRSSTRW